MVSILSFLPDFSIAPGLPQGKLGLPVALVYGMAAFGALSSGLLLARLLAAGLSSNAARKCSLLIYACLIVPVPLVLWLHNPWVAVALLGLVQFAHQGFSTNVFGLATDLFPTRIIGTAIGLAAFAGNMVGLSPAPKFLRRRHDRALTTVSSSSTPGRVHWPK